MNEKYEYAGRPLNKRLARPLIRKLYLGKDYHTVNEIKAGVLQYHLDQGGISPTIKSLRGVIYKILVKWEREEKAKRSNQDKGLWIILPSADDDTGRELAHGESQDIFEELKARDERIEKLEMALLLVLSSEIGNRVGLTADEYLGVFQAFSLGRVEVLLKEYGTTEKAIEKFQTIVEEKRASERQR